MAPVLAEVWIDWLIVVDLKPNTLASYSTAWRKYIAPVLGKRRVDDLGYRDWLTITKPLRGRPATCSHVISVARALHKHAMREGWATSNPADLVDMPSGNVRYRPVSIDEGRAVLDAAARWPNRLFGLYVRTLALTGARRYEVEAIRVSAIEAGGVFHLPGSKTKTGEPHFLVLDPGVALELVEQANDRPFLKFARDAGRHEWDRFCKAGGFENLHMHDLRRLVAGAATQTMDARTASTLLNHQSRVTDTVYSQASMNARVAASRRVAASITGV